MDDELHYIDLTPFTGLFSFVRSSLRDAGAALIGELISQCERGTEPRGHLIPSSWHLKPGVDGAVLNEPIPAGRR